MSSGLPDENEDQPIDGPLVKTIDAPLPLPALILGGAVLSNQYNLDEYLQGGVPQRTLRLAFRYGIRAIDTSIYYGPSEIVLGNTLQAIKDEFPRQSYSLMTKCGRFGGDKFDYSPDAIRDSVRRSLERLQTEYLDTVYLHDTEFICTPVMPASTGNHLVALKDKRSEYGLEEGQEGVVRGEGDQKVLDAFSALRELQEQGIIKKIGITAYPLPVLLRLSLLILHNPPYKPVDIIMSYSHLSLQNTTFLEFAPELLTRAKVGQIHSASPFSMGLLTPAIPPWHPAPDGLRAACAIAREATAGDLPNVALGYAIRACAQKYPLVVGLSNPKEVHECVKVWREVVADEQTSVARAKREEAAMKAFRDSGYLDWSWASP